MNPNADYQTYCEGEKCIHALRSETARLRALLDERTALLRECEASRQGFIDFCAAFAESPDPNNDDLSRRIAATLKETTCD